MTTHRTETAEMRLSGLLATPRCRIGTSLTAVVFLTLVAVTTGQVGAPLGGAALTEEPLYHPECRSPLGMQSQDIPDESLSASSSYDDKSVGPLNARIRTERNGGAWCPQPQITKDVYEFLEIDLGEVKVITMVETQGRFGNGQGLEFAPHYLLDYQRGRGDNWVRYHNHQRHEMIKGNTNTYLAELRELHPPIIARRVRFVPYSLHARTICMRVELHGCSGPGVMSYSMPQGESRGAEVDLYDLTYDGKQEDGRLLGGLGQLTDSNYGESSFRLDPLRTGHKGYGWVGWRNDSSDQSKPIEILFTFDKVRNFTAVTLYCNNQFDKDIRVFKTAEVYLSVGGEHFTSAPVTYHYFRDLLIPQARNVTIPLAHKVGKYVKLVLHFDARWLLISEVTFDSVIVPGNVTPEVAPATTVTLPPSPTTTVVKTTPGSQSAPIIPLLELPTKKSPEKSNDPGDESDRNVWPIRDQTSNKPHTESTPDDIQNEAHDRGNNMDDTYIGIIIGTLAAMILLLAGLAVFFVHRRRKKKYANGSLKVFGTDINDLTYGLTSAKLANGNMYNAVSTNENEKEAELHRLTNGDLLGGGEGSVQARRLPELPKSSEMADNEANICRDYCSPELSQMSPLVVSLPPCPVYQSDQATDHHGDGPPPPPPPPHARAVSAAADMVNIQGWSGNSMYAVPNSEIIWQEDLNILEFPRECLRFVDKLGEGQFGEVHLCEAQKVNDIIGDDFLVSRTGSRSMLVAVKMLRPDATSQARLDFHQEVKILSRLKDPNIVQVLGICTQGEPLAVVVEYMKYGDLHQFLLAHVPDTTLNQNKPLNLLSYGCLIYIATQIASGMKYLETLNMVHRDLATRNCLVGNLYNIKISDFGMSRSLYSTDYYRIEGKAVLPIRWMAWESVLLGKFSCKSDVWSFAVTLWEVLTFNRSRPFGDIIDDKVIENCGHYYRNDGHEINPAQPANCPKEIFDLMKECWNRDDTLRPTFREIHMFLSRKNMGYDPREEKPMINSVGYVPQG